MLMVCTICHNIIYDSDNLDNQKNANMCSACGNIVCDDCYLKENMMCTSCNDFFKKQCDHLDCVANSDGFCKAKYCAGALSYNKKDDTKEELSPKQMGEIYDAIARDLAKELLLDGIEIENITFIDCNDLEEFDDEYDDDCDFDDEEFDDMIDYFEKEQFDFGTDEDS